MVLCNQRDLSGLWLWRVVVAISPARLPSPGCLIIAAKFLHFRAGLVSPFREI
jgi:hypothetical protein